MKFLEKIQAWSELEEKEGLVVQNILVKRGWYGFLNYLIKFVPAKAKQDLINARDKIGN